MRGKKKEKKEKGKKVEIRMRKTIYYDVVDALKRLFIL